MSSESEPLLRQARQPTTEDSSGKSRIFLIGVIVFVLVIITTIGGTRIYGSHSDNLVKTVPFDQIVHHEPPTVFWGNVVKPYPTGAFWTNFAIGKGDHPVGLMPYGIKCVDKGVQVGYCASTRYVTQISVFDDFVADLQLSSVESYVSHQAESFDFMSVTMSYKTSSGGGFIVPLVKGSPFITSVYKKTTPVLSSELMHIVDIEHKNTNGGVGTAFIITLGNWQKWMVYCSESVAFEKSGDKLVATRPIEGFVRVAFLPPFSLSAFSTLMKYVNKYPTGASLSYSFPSEDTAILNYHFNTIGSGPLLMLALPHHKELLITPNIVDTETKLVQDSISPLYSIKGKMQPVIGDVWKLKYSLPKVGFNYDTEGHGSEPTSEQIATILESLEEDIKTVPVTFNDPYQFGKEISRMARLALIADEYNVKEAKTAALLALEKAFIPWLTGKNDDALKYDTTYGGIVPRMGLGDKYFDYGAAWYSDHHFHYGYFIYAAAVISKLDPKFADSYRAQFDTLVRDICTIDLNDKEFPFVRHKDFYDGHSWASGLFSQANGKGQESSSESVNAYYGIYLYAKETNRLQMTKVAHLLLAMEIQATKTYWHMKSNTEVYDPIFASGKMAGNIGALDATTTTWFGSELEFVHGINIMPITPVTAILLDRDYVQEEWPILGDVIPTPEEEAKMEAKTDCKLNKACAAMGLPGACCPAPSGVYLGCCDPRPGGARPMQNDWRSLLYADMAIINKDVAWTKLASMKGYGTGGSRTNFLLWAATRAPPSGVPMTTHPVNYTATIEPSCANNSACDALGLQGLCCPGGSGMSLGCCPKIVNVKPDQNQMDVENITAPTAPIIPIPSRI